MTSAVLINPQQAFTAWQAIYDYEVKPGTMAGQRFRMTIKPETRRDGQNARFHAMIGDIAEQIGGDLADPDDAKRILLSAFRIDTLKDYADEWKYYAKVSVAKLRDGEPGYLDLMYIGENTHFKDWPEETPVPTSQVRVRSGGGL